MTTLVEEEPYAVAIDKEYISLTCSKCFAWNVPNHKRVYIGCCTGCGVLNYCSAKCQMEDWVDHEPECKLLRSADFVPSTNARLIIRMIEKSKKDPDFKSFNGRTYDSLVHDSTLRRDDASCVAVYNEICRFMGSEAPDYDTVFLALSKKTINSFEIHDGSCDYSLRGTGLYLGLSILGHSCRPDAYVINQGSKLILRTTKEDCVYSDKLTISYYNGDFFHDTKMRREQLLLDYGFYCKCEECEDIESDKKNTSGRSACCPDSWFHIPDRICNTCKQEVSSELAIQAEDAMKLIRPSLTFYNKHYEDSDLSALVPEWINLFDSCKLFLSDENKCLFTVMNMIHSASAISNAHAAWLFAEMCLPHARKNLHCVSCVIIFTRRHQYCEMAKRSFHERKEALNEALGSAQVVFGPEHDLTQALLEWKKFYDWSEPQNTLIRLYY